jgi:UDP-glucose 4-epimerase
MNILITGAAGYIGQHLIKYLTSVDYNIDTLDILDSANPIDIRSLPKIKKEYHTVIHLAALVRVNESVKHPEEYYKTNITGTLNILNQINFKNFIFASTGAAEHCNSPYALSKRAAEDLVSSICNRNSIDYTIFRFYNVLGSDGPAPTNTDGLFYNLIKAESTGVFNLYGTDYCTKDGTCVRDYVHVNEICSAIIKAIDSPSNSVENLGHGTGWTVREIINTYKQANLVDFKVNEFPRRTGDLEISVLDRPSKYMETLYTIEQLLTNPSLKL